MITNAEVMRVEKKGRFPGIGEVYYHPSAVINVLSFCMLDGDRENFDVTHVKGSHFIVKNKKSGKIIKFVNDGGMYVAHMDAGKLHSSICKNTKYDITPYVLATIQTVEKNEKAHTVRDVTRAKSVLPLIQALWYTSRKDLKKILTSKSFANCPLTPADVECFYRIYGGMEGAMKGKTVRKTPLEVNVDENRTEILEQLSAELEKITMSLDIFFVDKIPFLTSISRKLLFSTARALKNREHEVVFAGIMEVINFYKMHKHEIEFILCDNEFGPLKTRLREESGAEMNLSAPNEHVPEVERNIKLIKERLRSTLAGMPYKKIPTNFKRELVLTCVSMLKVVPREAGVSDTLSPMELLTGRSLDFHKHCKLAPGSYCLVHEEHLPRNSMRERATGAIAIGPTSTLQGAYRFLFLKSGHIITRREWTNMPVPPEAIEKLENMAGDGDMEITFTYHSTTYSTADVGEPAETINETDDMGTDGINPPQEENETAPVEPNMTENAGDAEDNGPTDDTLDGVGTGTTEEEEIDVDEDQVPEEATEESPTLLEHASEPGGPAARTRSETIITGRKYLYRVADGRKMINELQFMADWEIGEVYSQFCLNKGLRLYGETAEKGVVKELLQFVQKDVLRPTSIDKLTPEKMRRALRLIMVVKEKRDGTIKGRGVADGSGQRGFINELDATSPTVSTEALMISCAIDAHEERAVLTVDIPGAYLYCLMDSEEYVFIEGVLVDLYLNADPSAKNEIVVGKNGKKRLYTKMNKALYGQMRSGRLFYEHIGATLRKMGFTPNPDELCVCNKDIHGNQMTVVLYVDDLKVSFRNEEGLNEFVKGLEKVYGKLEPNRNKLFDYCGINVDYRTKGVCKLSTPAHIEKANEDFEKENGKIRKGAKTLAQSDLFVVRDEAAKLGEERRRVFPYRVFARLLWIGVKTRPDTLVTLSFLGKRTTRANEDNWIKLERLLSYLQDARSMPLTLRIDDLQVVKWWADAAFAVHPDM